MPQPVDPSGDPTSDEALSAAVVAVQELGCALYRRLAENRGNVVCSPYSVALALAMARQGARGTTAAEIDQVLHSASAARLLDGLSELTRLAESRAGRHERNDGSTAEVSLDVASSLWGQLDVRWRPEFLEPLARLVGAGLREVDYSADPDGARQRINSWTAERTQQRIDEIVPAGVLDAETRLVLVNALYLKAPWEEPFASALTERRPFRVSDHTPVDVPTMTGRLHSAFYGIGPGWQAASLRYVGGALAMTIVVPDASLHELEAALDAAMLRRVLSGLTGVPLLHLQLPAWRFRLPVELSGPLSSLGMPTAFDPVRADFSGMSAQVRLHVEAVLHDAFVAVDEEGTEAAAATALVFVKLAMPTPVTLTADRPFLFVIHDVETATPFFIGRVDDPSAVA